jgi:hypothetical protein
MKAGVKRRKMMMNILTYLGSGCTGTLRINIMNLQQRWNLAALYHYDDIAARFMSRASSCRYFSGFW